VDRTAGPRVDAGEAPSRRGRRLLFATAAPFHPPYQGDSARVAGLLSFFRARGWKVYVVHCQSRFETHPDYRAMSRRCDGLLVYYPTPEEEADRRVEACDAWCPDLFAAFAAGAAREWACDAVIVQFAFMAKVLSRLPDSVAKVVDGDNLFAGRRARYQAAGLEYGWFSTDASDEARALNGAHLVLAIQEEDAHAFARMGVVAPILVVPHACAAASDSGPGADVLCVGSMNPANVDGLRRFVRHAWPVVRREMPLVHLLVAGGVGAGLEGEVPEGISLLGVLPTLDDAYRRAAIVINPIRAGGGVSIKSAEALAFGKCLVSTPQGVEGIEDADRVAVVVDRPEDFGEAIVAVLRSPGRLRDIQRRALAFARTRLSADAVYGPLEARLLSLIDACRRVDVPDHRGEDGGRTRECPALPPGRPVIGGS
jgi:glycosyltransferase involved in cell wall biosynthesis